MPYCTEDQVRAIVDTHISDAAIIELIEETDWWIDQRVTSGSISAIGYRKLSRAMTAYTIMLRYPTSQGLGEYSHDWGDVLKLLRDEIDDILATAAGDGMMFKYGYADLRWTIV